MDNKVVILTKIMACIIGFFIFIISILGNKIISLSFFDIFSYSLSFATVIIIFYERFLWKYLNIPRIPKIYGEYTGVIKYNYNNEDSTKEVKVVICQTFLTTTVKMYTDEIMSSIITSEIVTENDQDILYYTYRTNPKIEVINENPFNIGSARLEIYKNKLEGVYWTSRKTAGDILLTKVDK